jgi:hypothetical protein
MHEFRCPQLGRHLALARISILPREHGPWFTTGLADLEIKRLGEFHQRGVFGLVY